MVKVISMKLNKEKEFLQIFIGQIEDSIYSKFQKNQWDFLTLRILKGEGNRAKKQRNISTYTS